jgi:hypothetical protein
MRQGSFLLRTDRASFRLLLLQRKRKAQFLLPLIGLEKVTAHLLQIGALKLACHIPVDYLINRGIELLSVRRIAQQTDLQLRFFRLTKSTKQIPCQLIVCFVSYIGCLL